jgi:hypothetical protein
MIHAPKGYIWPSRTINPSDLMEEFYSTLRVAQRATHYQFNNEAFLDPNFFVQGDNVRVYVARKSVEYDWADGGSPDLSFDADRWDIPYNSGYAEIGAGDVAIDWTTPYPQLIWCCFSYQYIREAAYTGAPLDDFFPRVKVRTALDDVLVPGTGPYTSGPASSPRGNGMGQRAFRGSSVFMQMVGAGSHRVAPMAAQSVATETMNLIQGDAAKPQKTSDNDPITDQVIIGNRKTILITFGQGGWLGA